MHELTYVEPISMQFPYPTESSFGTLFNPTSLNYDVLARREGSLTSLKRLVVATQIGTKGRKANHMSRKVDVCAMGASPFGMASLVFGAPR